MWCATHSANFNEKVHKPQSKSYGRIGANMQLIFTHILWIWILLSVHHNFLGSEGLQGTHIDALNPFSLKLMTLTLRGGLWTFLANLALCVPSHLRRCCFQSSWLWQFRNMIPYKMGFSEPYCHFKITVTMLWVTVWKSRPEKRWEKKHHVSSYDVTVALCISHIRSADSYKNVP